MKKATIKAYLHLAMVIKNSDDKTELTNIGVYMLFVIPTWTVKILLVKFISLYHPGLKLN